MCSTSVLHAAANSYSDTCQYCSQHDRGPSRLLQHALALQQQQLKSQKYRMLMLVSDAGCLQHCDWAGTEEIFSAVHADVQEQGHMPTVCVVVIAAVAARSMTTAI